MEDITIESAELRSTDTAKTPSQLIAEWRGVAKFERDMAAVKQREADLLNHSADTYDICANDLEQIWGLNIC